MDQIKENIKENFRQKPTTPRCENINKHWDLVMMIVAGIENPNHHLGSENILLAIETIQKLNIELCSKCITCQAIKDLIDLIDCNKPDTGLHILLPMIINL